MKTWNAKAEDVERKWWVVDAEGKTLGRLASEVAKVLRGKNKPTFTPHVDTGDFVIVLNSDKVRFSGKKWADKTYYWKSRFFGSMRQMQAEELKDKDSTQILSQAIWGMLPKNRLGRQMFKKLKVYPTTEHPHTAQKPEAMSV